MRRACTVAIMSGSARSIAVAAMRRWSGPLIALAVACLVGVLIRRILKEYSWSDIAQAVQAVPPARIARGAFFAAASYFCLTLFDYLALRCVGHPLRYRRAALASFCSLSIGHNVGFAGLSSGAVRYRFYARWGLSFEEVAKLVIYCGLTVALGLVTVAGLSLLLRPDLIASYTATPGSAIRSAGAMLLLVPASYIGLTRLADAISVRGRTVGLPSTRLAAAQVAVGALNYLCLAACLHQLLGGAGVVAYFDVAAAYVLANTGVIASHVPGGLGVLESIVLSLLPGAAVLAAMLIFRVVYYLAPLAIGLALLGASEVALKSRPPASARGAAKELLQQR